MASSEQPQADSAWPLTTSRTRSNTSRTAAATITRSRRNSTPYTTPNAYTVIPGYGQFRPRWGDPDQAGEIPARLGVLLAPAVRRAERALPETRSPASARPVKIVLHAARGAAGSPQAVPATDRVYPGWSYNDAGLGASGRTDYAANDQVFFTTYGRTGARSRPRLDRRRHVEHDLLRREGDGRAAPLPPAAGTGTSRTSWAEPAGPGAAATGSIRTRS